ncbi:helix-turn-helix transcriptional regulator [Archangium violaceum]|uniref:helix-turn-helix domain-containing protein n=1 Tax=Archangium violaceum TaxID=83451 RepID=UPI00193C7856|nr:helix-turn-helix transcriptional regulator [Archangium violaceum]QRK09165.1 helix-turn-helix transcriptional regulator [Archangium violaceum]
MTDRQNEKKKLMVHLAAVVREARKTAELTQADVADRVGIVTEVFGRLERGYLLPSVPTFRRLCRVLRLDANIVLGLDVEKAPSWLKVPEPEADDPPELRRLVRTLRRMDAAQVSVMLSTANALVRHTAQRPDGQAE